MESQPEATEVEWMIFWLRAAPTTETAIGHTSHSSLSRQRQSPREAVLALEPFTFEAPPYFRHASRLCA